MFEYSKAGVKNINAYNMAYAGFIKWCKSLVTTGTFSTYCDGEPVCYSGGQEITYRMYQKTMNDR